MQRFILHGLGGGSVPGLSGGLDPYAISETTGPGAFRRVATQHFDKHLGKYDTVLPWVVYPTPDALEASERSKLT